MRACVDEGVSLRDGRAGHRDAPTARAPANFVTSVAKATVRSRRCVLPLNFVCSLRALAFVLLLKDMSLIEGL